MIIVGIDPGSKKSGWARIDVERGVQGVMSTFRATGELGAEPADVIDFLRQQPAHAIIAVETLRGIAYPVKGAGIVGALISSSRAAGIMIGCAAALGFRVVEMSAVEWRGLALGKPNANDQLIATVLPPLIRGWPKRSNVHNRDAAGCALGVAWFLGGREQLPGAQS